MEFVCVCEGLSFTACVFLHFLLFFQLFSICYVFPTLPRWCKYWSAMLRRSFIFSISMGSGTPTLSWFFSFYTSQVVEYNPLLCNLSCHIYNILEYFIQFRLLNLYQRPPSFPPFSISSSTTCTSNSSRVFW